MVEEKSGWEEFNGRSGGETVCMRSVAEIGIAPVALEGETNFLVCCRIGPRRERARLVRRGFWLRGGRILSVPLGWMGNWPEAIRISVGGASGGEYGNDIGALGGMRLGSAGGEGGEDGCWSG